MYKGTLIEDLFATVERAEAKAQGGVEMAEIETWFATVERAEAKAQGGVEMAEIETWFATVEENTSYESNLPGVA